MSASDIVIGIVGPSKSGKSTLKNGLEQKGYTVKHIAQEHSFAPTMWRKIANPDVLIYLDASFERTSSRGELNWGIADFEEELSRLENARQLADCHIHTDELSAQAVLEQAVRYLNQLSNKKE